MKTLIQLRAACASLALLSATVFFISGTFIAWRFAERAEEIAAQAEATLKVSQQILNGRPANPVTGQPADDRSIAGTIANINTILIPAAAAVQKWDKTQTQWFEIGKRLDVALERVDANLNDPEHGLLPEVRASVRKNDERADELKKETLLAIADLRGLLQAHREVAERLGGASTQLEATLKQAEELLARLAELAAKGELTRQRADELLIEARQAARAGKWSLVVSILTSILVAVK